MTQNMEKYFGFKVRLTEDLRPEDEAILRNRAQKIVNVEGIDLSKHHVYLHQLVIMAKDEHFGVEGGLTKRLNKLNIEFHINEKQRASGDIRFINHVIETDVPEDVRPSFTPEWIGYEIPITYFEKSSWFQNAIVAFVNKSVQIKKRKIKVVVTAGPLDSYLKVLRRDKSDVSTNLDLRFTKNVQLSLPFEREDARPSDRNPGGEMTFNNYGNVGAFGPNAVAHDFINNQHLFKDMQLLRKFAEEEKNDDAIDNIDKFMDCVSQKKNIKAIEYLKKIGVWALDKTETLGMVAATEAMKIAVKNF